MKRGLKQKEAEKSYLNFTRVFPLININVKEIKLSKELVDWMLKHRLEFKDGLHISTADQLSLPIVTSEKKKIKRWKKAYKGVLTEKEFWEKVNTIKRKEHS